MGYEQRIRLPNPSATELDELLRALPAFADFDPTYKLYNFRKHALSGMPDAHAAIEPDGLYFCDNGCGVDVFNELVSVLRKRFDPITIEEP